MEYIVLKLSTTGLDPSIDKITEVALLHYKNDTCIDTLHALINPQTIISEEAQKISGITNEDVKDCKTIEFYANDIRAFIGTFPIVGFNVQFDISFLTESGVLIGDERNIDVLRLARVVNPERGAYKFNSLCNEYNIMNNENKGALKNAYMVNDLFHALYRQLSEKAKAINEAKNTI